MFIFYTEFKFPHFLDRQVLGWISDAESGRFGGHFSEMELSYHQGDNFARSVLFEVLRFGFFY